MNLVEHYIIEIYDIEDITEKFVKDIGYPPVEPMIMVKMRVNCYGNEEDVASTFYLSKWEEIQKQGYYLA